MDELRSRQKQDPQAGLREVQKEGGSTEAEGKPMNWNSSCASGCDTCNCCTCGFRGDLFSSILLGLSYQIDKAISRPNFTSHIWTPLVVFSVHCQLLISLHLHPNSLFSLLPGTCDSLHIVLNLNCSTYSGLISSSESILLKFLHIFFLTYIPETYHSLCESLRCIWEGND